MLLPCRSRRPAHPSTGCGAGCSPPAAPGGRKDSRGRIRVQAAEAGTQEAHLRRRTEPPPGLEWRLGLAGELELHLSLRPLPSAPLHRIEQFPITINFLPNSSAYRILVILTRIMTRGLYRTRGVVL